MVAEAERGEQVAPIVVERHIRLPGTQYRREEDERGEKRQSRQDIFFFSHVPEIPIDYERIIT